MEDTPVTLYLHDSSVANDEGGGTRRRVVSESHGGRTRSLRARTGKSATQEDWLSLAAADPAFWLKGAGL